MFLHRESKRLTTSTMSGRLIAFITVVSVAQLFQPASTMQGKTRYVSVRSSEVRYNENIEMSLRYRYMESYRIVSATSMSILSIYRQAQVLFLRVAFVLVRQ